MNTVHTKATHAVPDRTVHSLIGYNMRYTAFVGQCGDGPAHSLYLITYEAIVLASNPAKTWVGYAAITIDRFCDVTIREN